MEKSHVSMEQRRCIVCGAVYDSGAILLDRRLRNTLEMHTLTGWGLCKTHDDPEFIHLIGCNGLHQGATIQPEDADRTGDIASVKVEAFERIFDIPPPAGRVAFVEQEVIDRLKGMSQAAQEEPS